MIRNQKHNHWWFQWWFSTTGGTPVHHPFLDWIFPDINHPAIGGTPWLWKPPNENYGTLWSLSQPLNNSPHQVSPPSGFHQGSLCFPRDRRNSSQLAWRERFIFCWGFWNIILSTSQSLEPVLKQCESASFSLVPSPFLPRPRVT